MKHILFAGVSILTLATAPALAQSDCTCPDTKDAGQVRVDRSDGDVSAARQDGPTRDALGDDPVNPGASARTDDGSGEAWNSGEMPFPPQDVSDNDLEPGGEPYPSGYPDNARTAQSEGDGDEAVIQPGDQVPDDIARYQGPDMWEGDGSEDVDSDSGPSTRAEKRARGDRRFSSEEGASFAWDGLAESNRYMRGRNHPVPDGPDSSGNSDRDTTAAVGDDGASDDASQTRENRSARVDGGRERAGDDRGTDRTMAGRGERRQRLAERARRSAMRAVPEARFQSYNFEIENGRRVIEIGGTYGPDDRRVEVDVYPNGRVQSVSQAIPLSAVPESVRGAVRSELGRFRVAQTRRSVLGDFNVYYEFAGISERGRPIAASIRADGSDLTVRFIPQ